MRIIQITRGMRMIDILVSFRVIGNSSTRICLKRVIMFESVLPVGASRCSNIPHHVFGRSKSVKWLRSFAHSDRWLVPRFPSVQVAGVWGFGSIRIDWGFGSFKYSRLYLIDIVVFGGFWCLYGLFCPVLLRWCERLLDLLHSIYPACVTNIIRL